MQLEHLKCPLCGAENHLSKIEENGEELRFCSYCGSKFIAHDPIKEYEKLSATVKLFSELSKGEESAKEKGWINSKDVKEILGL